MGDVHVLDLYATAGAGALPWAATVAVEVRIPPPLGTLLLVHHKPSWQLDREHEREQQAIAAARFVEDLVADRPRLPVVLLGDLDAGPEAASIRFLTGRQSLAATSVRYVDTWEALHPEDPGHTFTRATTWVRAGEMPQETGRRIDYIMVRSGAHGPPLEIRAATTVLDQPVDGVWASDHFGVLAELARPAHQPGTWA